MTPSDSEPLARTELLRSEWHAAFLESDETLMGIFTNAKAAVDARKAMTDSDRRDFEELDAAVARGVKAAKAVFEAGKALRLIRERQLFRLVETTWDAYVTERHGMTRRRADQLIAASVAMESVQESLESSGTVVPGIDRMTERAARELSGLAVDDAAAAVAEAAASDEGITTGSVARAARRRKKSMKAKTPRPRRFRVPGAVVSIAWNRKGDGAAVAALEAALGMAMKELEPDRQEAA